MNQANEFASDPVPATDARPGPGARRRWPIVAGLAAAAGVLFLSGLSFAPLWGTEGRWAEIAREMMASGDYFNPTINGETYFDKPLLSYWAILPASWLAGGVSEWTSRLPSALAGVGAVLAVFALGRKLFGLAAGAISAALLATAGLFAHWSRGASADILNLLAVWLALWIWEAGGRQGRVRHLVAFYPLLAVGCFLKGPVAGALAVAAAGSASALEIFLAWRASAWHRPALAAAFRAELRWLFSPGAFLGMALAAALFAALLLLPVFVTGSWHSAELMWRENVTRFFEPFDHKDDPIYAYVPHALLFFAPWSLLLLAALWGARKRLGDRADRTALCLAAGIFLFLTASGSRRDYYVLPLLPGLALVAGRALASWLEAPDRGGRAARLAMGATACLAALAPLAAVAVAFKQGLLRPTAGPLVAAAAVSAFIGMLLWLARTPRARLAALVGLVWCGELLFFTAGQWINARSNTLIPFARSAAERLEGVPDGRVAIYKSGHSRFYFYLGRNPLPMLETAEALDDFRRREPQGYVFAKARSLRPGKKEKRGLPEMEAVLAQEIESERSRDESMVLLRFAPPRSGEPATEDTD